MVRLKLLSGWNPWFFLVIAASLAICALWLYRRELRNLGLGITAWILPTLRALAIFLIVLTLAEPAIERRHREGEPGHVHVLIDGSNSMSINDSSSEANTNARNRFQRAVDSLVTPDSGLIDQLSDQFDISIWRLDPEGNALLWKTSLASSEDASVSSPTWQPNEFGPQTALGDGLSQLSQRLTDQNNEEITTAAQSTIVLMSDGQSNFGSSTESSADQLSKLNISVNSIGFGPEQQTSDLVLKAFEVPGRLFKTDQLSGRLILADLLPKGTDFDVQLTLEESVVWQKSLKAYGEFQREVRFDLAVSELYAIAQQKLPSGVQYNTLPMKLTAKLIASSNELNQDNNVLDAYLSVGASKAKILLVDGRSRWETRYVKNLFSRDPAWQIQVLVGDSVEQQALPQSRADWQQYHLVILGDIPAEKLNTSFQEGLVDFVNRGGGMIISDGARQHLHHSDYSALLPLLPVRILNGSQRESSAATNEDEKWTSQLNSVGRQLHAFNLTKQESTSVGEKIGNSELWKQLPGLEFIQSVSLKPGSEVQVEATRKGQVQPLIVSQRFGAGQVLYLASDETWRWRYKVADELHQKLWNQMARWIIRKPMSVESEYLSLDTGSARYTPGQPVEIRAALRQPDGSPAEGRRTVAVISRNGETITRVNLLANENGPGVYSSSLSYLEIGDYEVTIEAEGFNKEALLAKSSFAVSAPQLNSELLSTSCDSGTLKNISQITGGNYLPESDVNRLPELLRPLSGGKFVHSTRLIWQSYYWFFAALGLLAIEWVLRKRAGLI